jgi:glutamine amidotransferase-like uncharacterized protein
MKAKILCLITINLILGSTILPITTSISGHEVEILDESLCYGFIIPLVKKEKYFVEYNLCIITYNLVNDLLREKITVFWMAENQSLYAQRIYSNENIEILFERGSYVVPFSNNNSVNTKIVSIMCDYNQSNEINENLTKVPIYLLMNNYTINGYELVEVKIAHYRNPFNTDSEIYFVNAAKKNGFLNYDFLNPKSIRSLKKEDFNFLIYGYGDLEISPFIPPLYSKYGRPLNWIWEDLRYRTSQRIRNFVNNGGSYLGVCGGAIRAASGLDSLPLNWYFDIAKQHHRMPTFGFLCLIDCEVMYPNSTSGLTQLKIENNSHPITFGMDKFVEEYTAGSPRFIELGDNVDIISSFEDPNISVNYYPSWITSSYGKGKVILSSSHPELTEFHYNKTGCKFLGNSYYYATSEYKTNIQLSKSENITYIADVWNVTKDLEIKNNNSYNIFDNLSIKINDLINKMKEIRNELNNSYLLINKIILEENYTIDYDADKDSIHFLGRFSVHTVKERYLLESIQYLEDTIKKLTLTNNIYSYIKNNSEIVQDIENFNDKMFQEINDANNSLSNLKIYIGEYNDSLNVYRNAKFKKVRYKQVHNMLHKITEKIPCIFSNIVKSYFDIMKFLRHNWYDFESNLAII